MLDFLLIIYIENSEQRAVNRTNASFQLPAASCFIIENVNTVPFYKTDPIGLTLAADQAFIPEPDALDAVWQVGLDEDAPLSLFSTLGLQARSFHIFPQISLNKIPFERIGDFFARPRIDKIFSNYAKLTVTPQLELEAMLEFWLRSGSCLQGRITIFNHGSENLDVGARLTARLITLQGSSELRPVKQSFQNKLKGQSGNLSINLEIEGGSTTILSPNLALEQSKQLKPGQSLQSLWQCKLNPVPEETAATDRPFPVNWDGEIAKIEIANDCRMLQISTALPAWDAVIYSNQNQAFQLLRRDAHSAVRPDRSRSIHSAFTPKLSLGKSKISALELWQILNSLIPAQSELAAQIFKDFIEDALLDYEKNPQNALPFPCLCDLGWRIHQQIEGKQFLTTLYPQLKKLSLAWLSPQHDRDQDGIPEWSKIEQAGLPSLPNFNLLDEEGFPIQINATEQVNLIALLCIELRELHKMAQIAEDSEAIAEIGEHLSVLEAFLANYEDKTNSNTVLDFESGQWQKGELIYDGKLDDFGEKANYLSKASRLNLRLKPQIQLKKPATFYLHGENEEGEQVLEAIEPKDLLWLPGSFFYTTKEIYGRIEKISALDLKDCNLRIHTADLECRDIGLLFTLSDSETDDDTEASLETIISNYGFGIPETLNTEAEEQQVNLAWNLLLLADLIRKGESAIAYQLFNQLILAQGKQLSQEHNTSDRWDARTGRILASRNTIGGLIPVSLILDLAGIRIYNEDKLSIQGQNPFPGAFKLLYRGLEVIREGKNSTVRFQDGSLQHHFGSSLKYFVHRENKSPAE